MQPEQKPASGVTVPVLSADEALSAIGGGTLVTLRLKDATPEEIFDEISRQSGVRVQGLGSNFWEGSHYPAMSVNCDRRPFWPVLRTLINRYGLFVRGSTAYSWGLNLSSLKNDKLRGPTQVTGPFMILANKAQRIENSSVEFGDPQPRNHTDEFFVLINVFADPKLEILWLAGTPVIEEAVDDAGNALLTETTPPTILNDEGPFPGWELRINLTHPQRAGTHIAKLKGSLRFWIATMERSWEIQDVLNVAEGEHRFTLAGAPETYVLESVEELFDGEQYHVKTQILPSPSGEFWPWQDERLLIKHIYRWLGLMDGRGRFLAPVSSGTIISHVSGQKADGTWVISKLQNGTEFSTRLPTGGIAGKPTRLKWKTFFGIKQVEVRFEFTNLPMPAISGSQ